jgi:hypothetical protein
MPRGKPQWGDEVEEVIKNKDGKFFVANRAEEVPSSLVEKKGPFYWKKRNPDNKCK